MEKPHVAQNKNPVVVESVASHMAFKFEPISLPLFSRSQWFGLSSIQKWRSFLLVVCESTLCTFFFFLQNRVFLHAYAHHTCRVHSLYGVRTPTLLLVDTRISDRALMTSLSNRELQMCYTWLVRVIQL